MVLKNEFKKNPDIRKVAQVPKNSFILNPWAVNMNIAK
jgi:hypothetical protein